MSRYTTGLIKKMDYIVSGYEKDIIKVEEDIPNKNGYSFSNEYLKKYTLRNGNYILSGLSFSVSKAALVPFVYLYNSDDVLLKFLL